MPLSQLRSYDNVLPPKVRRSSSGTIDLSDQRVQRTLSRRRLLKATAGLSAGAMMASALSLSAAAQTGSLSHPAADENNSSDPQPIPGGIEAGGTLFHLYLPVPNVEPSTIGSFSGVVGVSELVGMGTTNDGERLPFVADQRFMTGEYVGFDGQRHQGSFALL
jgi:hypothetical protein